MRVLEEKLFKFEARFREMNDRQLYVYHRPLESAENCWAQVEGRPFLLLSSYSYLGLQSDPRIQEAASAALARYGTGSHGSPILSGTTVSHLNLQEELASFINCEDTMLFSSGYVANLATISTLCGPGDYVFIDKLNHASIIDGCALSGAFLRRFRHGDLNHLEHFLKEAPEDKTKLVVIDAVFSMDGDIADLPKISALCRQYGALLMVDEAHSLGVLGKTGRGIEEYFEMQDSIDIKMGVLSKALSCTGAYVGGDRKLINFLRHHARGYIFSGSLLPAVVESARASLKILRDEPWRVMRLRRISRSLRNHLATRGVDCGNDETPIIPVMTGTEEATFEIVRRIQDQGILVFGVLPPAVSPGSCRLRLCANAAMSECDLDFAAKVIAENVGHFVYEVARAL